MKVFATTIITFLLLALATATAKAAGLDNTIGGGEETTVSGGGTNNAGSLRGSKEDVVDAATTGGHDRSLSGQRHKNSFYYGGQYYEGYYGYACRGRHHNKGKKWHDYDVYYHSSFDQCKHKCSSSHKCKQFEYYQHGKHCELWYKSYGKYERKRGFSCFYKSHKKW